MAKHEIKALEDELNELRQRVEKLEALLAASKTASPAAPVQPNKEAEQEITPEIVLAISAAVAAFLGKRASIRQIRLSGESPWAMQGRATVQASHGIEFVRGRR
jgi:methylmalonyl-CoA carboxyltransferase large subunit